MREQYPFFREEDERTAAVIGEEAAASDLEGSYQKPYAVLTQNRLYCKNEQGNFIVALSGILSAGRITVVKNARLLWVALICIALLLAACVIPSRTALPQVLSLRLLNAGNAAVKAHSILPEGGSGSAPATPVYWDAISPYLDEYSQRELEEIYDRCGLEHFPQSAEQAQQLFATVTQLAQGGEDNALKLELAQLILKCDPDMADYSGYAFFEGWLEFVEDWLHGTAVSFDEETIQAADDFRTAVEALRKKFGIEGMYEMGVLLEWYSWKPDDMDEYLIAEGLPPLSETVHALNDGFNRKWERKTALDHIYYCGNLRGNYFNAFGEFFSYYPGAVVALVAPGQNAADALRMLELSARYGNPWDVVTQLGLAGDSGDRLSALQPYYSDIAQFSPEMQEELLLPLINSGKENISAFYAYQEYDKKAQRVEELFRSSPIPDYTQSLYYNLTSGELSPSALRLSLIAVPLSIYVSLLGGLAALVLLCLKRLRPAALCACAVGLVGVLRGLLSPGSFSLFTLPILVTSLAVVALSLLFLVSGKKSVFQIVTTGGVFAFKEEEYSKDEISAFLAAASSAKAGA